MLFDLVRINDSAGNAERLSGSRLQPRRTTKSFISVNSVTFAFCKLFFCHYDSLENVAGIDAFNFLSSSPTSCQTKNI